MTTDIGLVMRGKLNRFPPILGLRDHNCPRPLAEHILDQAPSERVIVRDHHANGTAGIPAAASLAIPWLSEQRR